MKVTRRSGSLYAWLLTFSAVVLTMLVAALPALAADTSDFTSRSFHTSGVREISFSTQNGPIEVMAHSGNNIEVQIVRKARSFSESQAQRVLESIQISTTQSGGRVLVNVQLPKFVLFGSAGAEISALVPATWQGKLTLDTTNGSIDVAGLRGSGIFNTSNGAVSVDEWQGYLQVSTSNGSIDASRLKLSANSSFKTSNGDLSMGVSELAAALTLHTSNGVVHVMVPSSLKATVDANTSNGTVLVTGATRTQSAKNSLSAQLNGGGAPININTSNNSVTIEVIPGKIKQ